MLNGSRWKHVVLIAATGGLVLAAGASAASAANGARKLLPASTPTWAKAAPVASASKTASVAVRVYLAPRGGVAAVKAAVTAVSTPGNGQYRHFLTPAQYRARFEPSAAQVAKVSTWLRSSGLRVAGVESSRRYISASGTVSVAEKAFGTTLNVYRHAGRLMRAPATGVSVPSSVSGSVIGVTGLATASGKRPKFSNPPPPASATARPCSLTYGQLVAKTQADYDTPLPKFKGKYRDYAVCGYVPSQLRSAYGVSSTTLTGKGATIGIVDPYASSTILDDTNRYSRRHGDPAFAAGQFTQKLPAKFTHGALCDAPGWSGEETLDIQASHGMAPGAHVVYYSAASCLDVDLLTTLARVVDDNRADVVSNSWGGYDQDETSGDIAAYEQVLLQGALQGISFLWSSGDDGDEQLSTGLRQTDYPASDPWQTAVGGTSTAIAPSGKMSWQTGWGTNKYDLSANGRSWVPTAANPFWYGSGGGYSTLFNRPVYQHGVVTGGAPAGRAVPDVAMNGDPTTGMLIGQTQTFPHGVRYGEFRLGGTSLSSPLMAGVLADALQHTKSVAGAHARFGLLNPALYAQARAHAGTLTDVKGVHSGDGNARPDYANGINPAGGILYSVRTFNQDSSLVTKPGWDDVTGLGTPNALFLTAFGN